MTEKSTDQPAKGREKIGSFEGTYQKGGGGFSTTTFGKNKIQLFVFASIRSRSLQLKRIMNAVKLTQTLNDFGGIN